MKFPLASTIFVAVSILIDESLSFLLHATWWWSHYRSWPADLVLLSMGFVSPEQTLINSFGEYSPRYRSCLARARFSNSLIIYIRHLWIISQAFLRMVEIISNHYLTISTGLRSEVFSLLVIAEGQLTIIDMYNSYRLRTLAVMLKSYLGGKV